MEIINRTRNTDGQHVVWLDAQPLRSPENHVARLQSRELANAVAAEWNAQGETLKANALPIVCVRTGRAKRARDLNGKQTAMIYRAMDSLSEKETRRAVEKELIGYLNTDSVW